MRPLRMKAPTWAPWFPIPMRGNEQTRNDYKLRQPVYKFPIPMRGNEPSHPLPDHRLQVGGFPIPMRGNETAPSEALARSGLPPGFRSP